MHRRAAAALVPLLLLSACEVESDPEDMALTEEDRRAIRAVHEQYEEGILAGDLEGIYDLFYEDAIRIYSAGPVEGPEEFINPSVDLETGGYTEASFEQAEIDGRGDMAYVWGEVHTVAEDPDGRVEWEGTYIAILRKDDAGEWKIHRQMLN